MQVSEMNYQTPALIRNGFFLVLDLVPRPLCFAAVIWF